VNSYIYIGLFVVGLLVGWTVNNWRWEAKHESLKAEIAQAYAESERKAREIEQLNAQKALLAGQKTQLKIDLNNAKGETITKEVIKYVYENPNASCAVDPDFMRIYNDSVPVSSTPSGSPGIIRESG